MVTHLAAVPQLLHLDLDILHAMQQRHSSICPHTISCISDVCAGADVQKAGNQVMQSVLNSQEARWFRGECVWAPQQLESELNDGLHVLVQADLALLQPLRCAAALPHVHGWLDGWLLACGL